MIFEICISIATIVFVILAFYIIQTLKVVQCSLKDVKKSIENLEIEVALIKINANQLLKNSNEIAEKINCKIDDITPLFDSIFKVGGLIREAVNSFEGRHLHVFTAEEKKSNWQEKVFDLIELTSLGIKVFQQIQKRK